MIFQKKNDFYNCDPYIFEQRLVKHLKVTTYCKKKSLILLVVNMLKIRDHVHINIDLFFCKGIIDLCYMNWLLQS